MEDAYLRYGLVLVGLALFGILVAFAWKASNAIELVENKKEQSVRGDSERIVAAIGKLCSYCLKNPAEDRDCYILRADMTEGTLNSSSFGAVKAAGVHAEGRGSFVFKVAAFNRSCVVRQIV